MSRIRATFEALRAAGRKALIPYVTAGHPRREVVVPLMHAMAASGADIIELGVPFSDPMADGPVIQRSSEKALALGVGLGDVLDWVREFRRDDDATPVVLMGYANPIERMGQQPFLQRAADAGVDGVLVVDYPPEESEAFAALAREHGVDPIFLLAPTSRAERIAQVARVASGYVYYVSLKGVTGAGNLDVADVLKMLPAIREATGLPVGVGFGIRDGATARAIARGADAVVIGTRLIQELDAGAPEEAAARAGAFLAEIRRAMDAPDDGAKTKEAPR
jgi:tryptophan synthase alpha chain